MSRPAAALAVLLLLSSTPLAAQDAVTPFRGGQWAAQFGWEGGLGSLGVLAFTAPTRAWLLDVQFLVRHAEVDADDPFGTPTSGDDDLLDVFVSAGRRFYQARGAKVVTHQTIGLLGGYFRNHVTYVGATGDSRGSAFGVFGDLGAAYNVTPNLSLGFTGTLQAYNQKTKVESPNGVNYESAGFTVSAPSLLLVATIYF